MEQKSETKHIKRTQKDYSLPFKLQVVSEVENGHLSIKGAIRKYGIQSHSTVLNWCRKFGNFDREYQIAMSKKKTPQQRILELEQQVRKLEMQKRTLENQVEEASDKAIIFDMMIDVAEEQLNIPIRKKYSPKLSKNIKGKKENL